jgi:hypothetical protein
MTLMNTFVRVLTSLGPHIRLHFFKIAIQNVLRTTFAAYLNKWVDKRSHSLDFPEGRNTS